MNPAIRLPLTLPSLRDGPLPLPASGARGFDVAVAPPLPASGERVGVRGNSRFVP
jgi:hypothetical protein